MTMRERIASGKLFTDYCEGLPEDRLQAKRRMHAFNITAPDNLEKRTQLMQEIFGKETKVWIEPPFTFAMVRILRLEMERTLILIVILLTTLKLLSEKMLCSVHL